MWKKEEMPAPTPAPRMDSTPTPERPTPTAHTHVSSERATIGRSITIRGEVTGDEDLLIQGRVDGSVDLKQHSVTVGREGEVKANIIGRVVTVEGKVEGNLSADEQVILRASATVQGDITAPRVVLEDGARFRGGVDMGESAGPKKGVATPSLGKKPESNKPAEATDSSSEKRKSEAGAGITT
jgi:cytoskeletal protein CcmA (bactofilin family)